MTQVATSLSENTMYCIESIMCYVVFFIRFPRKKHLAARVVLLLPLTGCALHLIAPLLGQNSIFAFFYYVLVFGIYLAAFHFCFETTWEQALYISSAGKATQHLINQIVELAGLFVDPSGSLTNRTALYFVGDILLYIPFCLVAYFTFSKRLELSPSKNDSFQKRMNLTSLAILFVCTGITRFAKGSAVSDQNALIAQNLYAITCCVLCLLMQTELCKQASMTKEIDLIRLLWSEDGRQFKDRKETIELINIKCHDIRHKLDDYQLPLSTEEKNELKSLIHIYDQTYQTGNAALDVLLEKYALLHQTDRIQLSFMGDGSCLGFLTESEIYSLFGNALENATEAVSALEEEKRQVSMIIRTGGDIVSISVTNFYKGELHFEDGLPLTTHANSEDLHGYGMKSIRAIARKYGGDVSIKAENNVFELNIWLVNDGSACAPPAEALQKDQAAAV